MNDKTQNDMTDFDLQKNALKEKIYKVYLIKAHKIALNSKGNAINIEMPDYCNTPELKQTFNTAIKDGTTKGLKDLEKLKSIEKELDNMISKSR